MEITGTSSYVALMCAFVAVGWILHRGLPFHRRLFERELSGTKVFAMDGLRGILALSVYVHHAAMSYDHLRTGRWDASLPNFNRQLGVAAVSIFFMLSGYIFWRKLSKPPMPIVPFLYGRFMRIGPAYLFACLLLFGMTAVLSHLHRMVPFAKLVLQSISWLSLIGAAHTVNGLHDSERWLGQVWTLRFEFLFYLVVPFLGWFAVRRSRLFGLIAIAGLMGFLIGDRHHGGIGGILSMLGGFATYFAHTFSFGMVVATFAVSEAMKRNARRRFAALLSLAVLGMTLYLVPAEHGWVESFAVLFPFLCVTYGNTWFGLLTWGPVRFLGRVSFSFFLLHYLVLEGTIVLLKGHVNLLARWPYLALAAFCGSLTIFLSAYTYQFLEHPFLHLARTEKVPAQFRSTSRTGGLSSGAAAQGRSGVS